MTMPRPCGWIPEEALQGAPGEEEATATLLHIAVDLVRRGGKLLQPGRDLCDARTALGEILLSYRVERALIRRALQLSPTATTADVLAAVEQRGRT